MTPEEQAELEQLAQEETKLAADADAIATRREEIKAILRDRLPVGTHTAGPYTIQVRNGAARLDTDTLMAAYPVVVHPEMYRPALVTAEVRKRIAPVDLEQYTVHGNPTVVVK